MADIDVGNLLSLLISVVGIIATIIIQNQAKKKEMENTNPYWSVVWFIWLL